MRKLFILLILLFFLATLLYLFRARALRSCAQFLIEENTLTKVDAMFVLSGGGYDRGNEAVKIFNASFTNKIICTGGNAVTELCVMDIDTLESDMTAANLRQHSIPDSCIVLIRNGTSTKEEAQIILDYCFKNNLKKIIVLSSKLHTHRVNSFFRSKFLSAGIEPIVCGAPSSRFNEMEWWREEEGLIAVNNEWIKTVYYWCKY
ncbi:MAG: YdcF family protein [Bacteroidetes bacterium]|nr:YdcF family protein [Bacteroidota bacterium]